MEQKQEEALYYFKEQLLKGIQEINQNQNRASCLALIESIEKAYGEEAKTITLIF